MAIDVDVEKVLELECNLSDVPLTALMIQEPYGYLMARAVRMVADEWWKAREEATVLVTRKDGDKWRTREGMTPIEALRIGINSGFQGWRS